MDSKDRAKLRSIAMGMQPSTQIGKNGITDTVMMQIDQQLEASELIKVAVLKNAEISAKDIAEELAKDSRSEIVQVLGEKITLYRFSHKEKIKHLI